jgi:hypothetical protein
MNSKKLTIVYALMFEIRVLVFSNYITFFANYV